MPTVKTPISVLARGGDTIVAAAGSRLIVHTQAQAVRTLDLDPPNATSRNVPSSWIIAAAVRKDGVRIAVSLADKRLVVLDVATLKTLASFVSPKRTIAVLFDNESDIGDARSDLILIADKFGCVFHWNTAFVPKLSRTSTTPSAPPAAVSDGAESTATGTSEASASTSTTSSDAAPAASAAADNGNQEEEEDGLTLLLGHCSILTGTKLTRDKKYLVTSDRDEKIRVSRYPESYVIVSYLLGHTDYIAGFQIIEHTTPPLLVSGSGDGTLRLWNMLTGAELQCITLCETGEQTVVPVAYDSGSELLLVVLEGETFLHQFRVDLVLPTLVELPPLDVTDAILYPAASVIPGPARGSFVCASSAPDYILSFHLTSDNTVFRQDKPARFFELIRYALPDIDSDQLANYSFEHLLLHEGLRKRTFAERHGKTKRDESNNNTDDNSNSNSNSNSNNNNNNNNGAGSKRQKTADTSE